MYDGSIPMFSVFAIATDQPNTTSQNKISGSNRGKENSCCQLNAISVEKWENLVYI